MLCSVSLCLAYPTSSILRIFSSIFHFNLLYFCFLSPTEVPTYHKERWFLSIITENSSNTLTGEKKVQYVQNNKIQLVRDRNVRRNWIDKCPSPNGPDLQMVYCWWLVGGWSFPKALLSGTSSLFNLRICPSSFYRMNIYW